MPVINAHHSDLSTSFKVIGKSNLSYPGNVFSTEDIIQIVSSDAADTSSGVGAQKVFIEGYDNNGEPLSEELSLNGTSAVSSTNNYRVVSNLYVSATGASGTQGNLTATKKTGGSTVFVISSDYNKQHEAMTATSLLTPIRLKYLTFTQEHIGDDRAVLVEVCGTNGPNHITVYASLVADTREDLINVNLGNIIVEDSIVFVRAKTLNSHLRDVSVMVVYENLDDNF